MPLADGSILELLAVNVTKSDDALPNVVLPSIDASVTTLRLFTFASADTSTSACAVISPDALIVFAFRIHLASSKPNA